MIKFIRLLRIPEGIKIPVFGGFWYNLIRYCENKFIRKVKIDKNPINHEKRAFEVIVSLTSFPSRIKTTHLAIKSLMLQTFKPDRIILWLAEEQFINHDLPPDLVELIKKGLEIRYCTDLKSHKKYYFAMKEFKKSIIITYDDDLIYHHKSIEKLINKHKEYPNAIICNRGMHIIKNNGQIESVKNWKVLSKEGVRTPSYKIMASTGAGCLYPASCLKDEVFNKNKIFKYAITADDIWMKFMGLVSDVKVLKTTKYCRALITIQDSQEKHLAQINTFQGMNDVVFKNLYRIYSEEVKKLD